MNKVENSFLYNKFVVRDMIDFDEVDEFVDAYKKAGVKLDSVFCMPKVLHLSNRHLQKRMLQRLVCLQDTSLVPRLHINHLVMLGELRENYEKNRIKYFKSLSCLLHLLCLYLFISVVALGSDEDHSRIYT